MFPLPGRAEMKRARAALNVLPLMLILPLLKHSFLHVSNIQCWRKCRTLVLATGLSLPFVLATPFDSAAVLIATGDGTGNTTAPAADPGFANVGVANGLSGVYVRNGWVLTASHVGAQPITLAGVLYDPIAGSGVQFQNIDGTSADLIVYKLQIKPPLPDLVIATSAPSLNTQITMIGNGKNRGAATTFSGANGWLWGAGRTLRWGTNRISNPSQFVQVGSLWTQSFSTQFDDIAGGPPGQHEADLVNGDSGGAAFTGSGANAELVGILFARAAFVNQPTNTSIFGNLGFIVDLFNYRNDILAIIDQPDCSNGLDDDGDGLVDFPNDPGCANALDNDERGAPFECDNGLDDDGDGAIDFPDDSGCKSATDDSEFVAQVPNGLLGAGILTLASLRLLTRIARRRNSAPTSNKPDPA